MTTDHIREQRHLAAIMFTDMVGFSAMTQRNEALALSVLDDHWKILRAVFPRFGGEEIRSMGDGVFLRFPSALDAVRCGIAMQEELHEHNTTAPAERRIQVRIGIHLGDVVAKDGNVFGDGVNIAARIEPLAPPGGICVSEDVARQVHNKIDSGMQKLGRGDLKNISLPVEIFRVVLPWDRKPTPLADQIYFTFRKKRFQVWGIVTGVVSVMVAVFLIWRTFFPATQAPQVVRLGVLPFATPAAADSLASGDWNLTVQSLFVQQLLGVEGLGVVDPLSLNGLLEGSFGTTEDHRPDPGKVMTAANLSIVVDGTIRRNGEGYSLEARLLDPKSGAVYLSGDEPLRGETDIPHAVDALSQKIIGFLQLRVLQSGKDGDLRPWIAHRTRNIEAARAFMQASQYIYRGEPGSEKYLRRALELDSTFIPPRIWLISVLVTHGDLEQARYHYRLLQTMEEQASPFDAVMIEWSRAFIEGDYPAQARQLQVALEYSPDNNILMANLAGARFLMHDYAGALEAAAPSIEASWPYSKMYYLAGLCHLRLHDREGASTVLRKSLSIQPVHNQIYALLATLATTDGDLASERTFEEMFMTRSRELGMTESEARFSLARTFLDEGDPREAIRIVREHSEPRSPVWLTHLGDAYVAAGVLDSARDAFSAALAIDPADASLHLKLGRVFEHLHDSLQARTHFQAYLRADSTSEEALELRKHTPAQK